MKIWAVLKINVYKVTTYIEYLHFSKNVGINLPMEFNKQVANEMNKEKERKVLNY